MFLVQACVMVSQHIAFSSKLWQTKAVSTVQERPSHA